MLFNKTTCRPASARALCTSILNKAFIITIGVCIGIGMYRTGIISDTVEVKMTISGDDKPTLSDKLIYQSENGSIYLVPNIVHFIWFGKGKKMSFVNYVSILSAHRMHRPDVIMLHCNHLPVGQWWARLKQEIPLKITHMRPPNEVHGQSLFHVYHQGDVAKMQVLRRFGGIYIDYDVIVLQSLDPLRKYPMTMGKEQGNKLNAGVVVANKQAMFLNLWYESYRNNYRAYDWDFNCARVPFAMYKQQPQLLHVEKYRLTTPDWREREKLWDYVINWRELYVVHLMTHLDWSVYTPENIKKMNNTFGEIMRHVYYNSSKIVKN